MKELLEKINLKTKIIIGVCIVIVISLGVVLIKKKTNTPESTMDEYVNALIDGKYKDVVDLCYFPDSKFITDKKIDSLKKYYYKKMKGKMYDIVDCSYSLSEEGRKYTTYKVIIKTTYKNRTEYVDVRNEDNKIDNKDFYGNAKVKLYKDATLYIDGEKVTEKPKIKKDKNGIKEEVYTVPVVKEVDYSFYGKHPVYVYKKKVEDINNYTDTIEWSKKFKKDFIKKLNSDVKEAMNDIAKTYNDNGDLNSLNKYFKNKNAKEFCDDNDFSDKDYSWSNPQAIEYTYKGIGDTSFSQRYYVSKNKMYVTTYTSMLYEETARKDFNGIVIITDDEGKLVSSYTTSMSKEVSAIWEYINGKWVISTWKNN